MANKTWIWVIVAIIVIAGGYYFYSGGNVVNDIKGSMGSKLVPRETSSSDQIVDYIVDGLSSDMKVTTQTAIDGTTVPSQTGVANSINTNF